MLQPAIFNPRVHSLARGNSLVFLSLLLALPLSHFPHLQQAPALIVPGLLCIAGTAETARCMQTRWSFYHGGVLLCLYMDLMALLLVFFCLLYPYFLWLTGTH